MFIPKFVSQQLRSILANQDLKSEAAITHDLGEFFAMGPMPEMLRRSEGMAEWIGRPPVRKIVRSKSNKKAA